jgi:hypothetical protein
MLIYTAGAIRPKYGQTLQGNLKIAKDIALELWKDGFAVICPHANTDLPMEMAEKEMDTVRWLDGDCEMIARCDAVLVIPGWEASAGTRGEIEFAEKRNIPVFYYPDKPAKHATEIISPIQCKAFMDVIMSMYRIHLQKNADYSPANILGTGELGVVVRLWDKIARLMNLTGFRLKVEPATFDKPTVPKNESVDDAYMDLSVYGIIGMLLRKGAWGK